MRFSLRNGISDLIRRPPQSCCRKGDPFQGPKLGSCLTFRNELSEETHVLTKQAILLGKGARVESSGGRGIDLIEDIMEIFMMHDIKTEIIAASVRNPIHVIDCAKAGADIATVPFPVIMQMIKHPLTDQGIAKFQADYRKVFGE